MQAQIHPLLLMWNLQYLEQNQPQKVSYKIVNGVSRRKLENVSNISMFSQESSSQNLSIAFGCALCLNQTLRRGTSVVLTLHVRQEFVAFIKCRLLYTRKPVSSMSSIVYKTKYICLGFAQAQKVDVYNRVFDKISMLNTEKHCMNNLNLKDWT